MLGNTGPRSHSCCVKQVPPLPLCGGENGPKGTCQEGMGLGSEQGPVDPKDTPLGDHAEGWVSGRESAPALQAPSPVQPLHLQAQTGARNTFITWSPCAPTLMRAGGHDELLGPWH